MKDLIQEVASRLRVSKEWPRAKSGLPPGLVNQVFLKHGRVPLLRYSPRLLARSGTRRAKQQTVGPARPKPFTTVPLQKKRTDPCSRLPSPGSSYINMVYRVAGSPGSLSEVQTPRLPQTHGIKSPHLSLLVRSVQTAGAKTGFPCRDFVMGDNSRPEEGVRLGRLVKPSACAASPTSKEGKGEGRFGGSTGDHRSDEGMFCKPLKILQGRAGCQRSLYHRHTKVATGQMQ